MHRVWEGGDCIGDGMLRSWRERAGVHAGQGILSFCSGLPHLVIAAGARSEGTCHSQLAAHVPRVGVFLLFRMLSPRAQKRGTESCILYSVSVFCFLYFGFAMTCMIPVTLLGSLVFKATDQRVFKAQTSQAAKQEGKDSDRLSPHLPAPSRRGTRTIYSPL